MASAKHARYIARMPRVVVVDRHAPEEGPVGEAVRLLRAGGLVALPTETVYGLGARALDERAIARIFQAKGRPAHHPLIAHVLDEDQARALAASWPEQASRLANAFWPGPLTLVVDRAAHVPAAVAGGGGSIAVRAPSHRVARAVIAGLGEPVAAPSANRYQGLSPTTAAHVVKQLGEAVDLVLDAGPCDSGIESTVVDVRGAIARVLRPGAVDIVALRACVSDLEACVERSESGQPRVSPGLDTRHYAPRAPLWLASTLEEAERLALAVTSQGRRVGLVVRGPATRTTTSSALLVRELPGNAAQYARLLYGTLHELDDAAVDAIVVQAVPSDDAWAAVADRLHRAAEMH
jgi:L-threonylcarbamoyladenylate synthase